MVPWLVSQRFPWLALGYTQTDTWLAGFAPVGGVYTVSLAVTLCAGAVTAIVLGNKNTRIAAASVIGVVWLIGLADPQQRMDTKDRRARSASRIVQGAVPQEMKWEEDQRDKTIALYRGLTREHLGTKLIIWPEARVARPVA